MFSQPNAILAAGKLLRVAFVCVLDGLKCLLHEVACTILTLGLLLPLHCREAHFSVRIVADKATVIVGGADKYQAACRRCYNKHEREWSADE